MFNNKFLKNDPLLEAVKSAQAEGAMRRQAEAIVNEEFGVYSRKAVVREQLAAYDAALETTYTQLKEGWEGSKEDKAEDKKLAKKHGMTMKQWEKSDADKKHDAKEKLHEKMAKRDWDGDDKIESEKAEVLGSRIAAAKRAGRMEEKKMWEGSEDTGTNEPTQASKDIAAKTASQTPDKPYADRGPSGADKAALTSKIKSMNEEKKKWIQAAIKKKGALSKQLGVPEKKNIPVSKLKDASDEPGKLGKRARLALTLRKLHKEESDSFKAAQVTGKSVNEVAMGMPPAITPPSISGQRMPGIIKRGGTATGKFVNPTTASANQTPKTGTGLVKAGNRLPTPASSSGAVTTAPPASKASSGFSYSRMGDTPRDPSKLGGMNAADKIAATAEKATSGTMKSLVQKIAPAAAGIARVAANPYVAGASAAASVMEPKPLNAGENEKARQAKYGQSLPNVAPGQGSSKNVAPVKGGSIGADVGRTSTSKTPAPTPAAATAPAAGTAKPAPVKQTFSQAFRAARDAATAAKQDPNKAQFKWTSDKGKEGTYQAATSKSQYVAPSKQFKTTVGTSDSNSASAAATPAKATAPLPPARPKDLPSTSSVAAAPTPPQRPAELKQMSGAASTVPTDKFQSSAPKDEPVVSQPEPKTQSPGPSTDDIIKALTPKKQSVQESVQVGANKYRIV